jgi:esterase
MTALDLSFTEAGDGPPLVILHGLFGSKRNWGMIAKALARNHRVIAADLRNHGDSPWHDEMTYAAMAADIARLIETRVGGPANVIGHSMGGKASMVLALTQPDHVDRLIIADIPPAPRNSGLDAYVSAMAALDIGAMARRADVETHLEPAIPEKGIRSFLAQNVVPHDESGMAWKLNLPVIGASMPHIEDFPDIDSEDAFPRAALHLVGGKSEYVLPAHHAEIDRLFPLAEIAEIPDAGHWLHAEQPKAFIEAVEAFLS